MRNLTTLAALAIAIVAVAILCVARGVFGAVGVVNHSMRVLWDVLLVSPESSHRIQVN